MSDKTCDEILHDSAEMVINLRAERAAREGNLHTDDHRIATEVAERMYRVGRLRRDFLDQQERWRVGIIKNAEKITEIEAIYADLAAELDIAAKNELPKP